MIADVPIVAVWRRLGGDPLRGARGNAFWRDGDSYSIALDPVKGTWFDHRDAQGGGILTLVETVLGCDRRSAVAWLEGEGFIEPWTLTREQRGERERRRVGARSLSGDISDWKRALVTELNVCKLAAVESGNDEALSRAASKCNLLENGSPEGIVREFIRHRGADPMDVGRLIVTGQADDFEAQRITAEVVLLLARKAEEDSSNAA